MKFRVIIDKTKEEEIVATVHQRTDMIDEIEAIILRDEGTITAFLVVERKVRQNHYASDV